jgi:hypothetical protein
LDTNRFSALWAGNAKVDLLAVVQIGKHHREEKADEKPLPAKRIIYVPMSKSFGQSFNLGQIGQSAAIICIIFLMPLSCSR